MPVTQDNYIYRQGTAPNTRAAVSQKNKIYSYATGANAFQQLGVISEFGFDESRTIDSVRGVGYGDIIAELVPNVTESMTLTLNKTLLYTANLFQMVGYKGGIDGLVRSLRHHRWPFDIKQELVFSEIASSPQYDKQGFALPASQLPTSGAGFVTTDIRALFTYFEGCWFNSYSASFTADAAMVSENSSVNVTDVISGTDHYGEFVDTGLAPIADNGAAGKGYSLRFAGGAFSPLVG
jgi:hypothetical protein